MPRCINVQPFRWACETLWATHLKPETVSHSAPALVCLNHDGDFINCYMDVSADHSNENRTWSQHLAVDQVISRTLWYKPCRLWQQVKHPNPCLCRWKPRWAALHSTCWLAMLAALNCLTGYKQTAENRLLRVSYRSFPQIRSRYVQIKTFLSWSWVPLLTWTPDKW